MIKFEMWFILAALFFLITPGLFAQGNTDPKLVLPIGHTAGIGASVFSSDGKMVATASVDQTVRIWDTQSGKLLKTLQGHTKEVYSAAFSVDGRILVTASEDSTARIWSTENGETLHHLKGHRSGIRSAAISADGKFVVTASADNDAIIWNVKTGKLIHRLKGHTEAVYCAAFSPDGSLVITASWDRSAILWNVKSGKIQYTLRGHAKSVESASFSPDGNMAVTASLDGLAILWDTGTGVLLDTLQGHDNGINSAVFSRDGRFLATASRDRSACLWDVQRRKLLHRLVGHNGWINSIDFSPDGRQILTTSWDKTVRLWDSENGVLLRTLSRSHTRVYSAAFSPDGRKIITAAWDGEARIWDVATGESLHDLVGHTKIVETANFSSDGKFLVSVSQDKIARVWDTSSGDLLYALEYEQGVRFAKFSPGGRLLLTVTTDNIVTLWEVDSGKQLHEFKRFESYVHSASFSSDGNNIAIATSDNATRQWDVRSGQMINLYLGHTADVNSAEFSPDGRWLVTSSSDGTARKWDTQSGLLVNVFHGHSQAVNFSMFSPDGRIVVTTSDDRSAKFWNTESGNLLFTMEGIKVGFVSVGFSPDSGTLLTVSDDNEVGLWSTQSGRLVNTLKGHRDHVNYAVFSPDGLWVLTGSKDGTMKTWDLQTGSLFRDIAFKGELKSLDFNHNRFITHDNSLMNLYDLVTGKLLYSFVAVDRFDHLLLHPDGFFDGTEVARELLYFVCHDQVIDLAQLKDALYVPGLGKKIIGGQSIAGRKLSELGICDALPIVEPMDDNPYRYKITPRRLSLERVHIYVNDKLVFNMRVDDLKRMDNGYEVMLDTVVLSENMLPGVVNLVRVQGVVRTEFGSELRSRGLELVANGRQGSRSSPRLYAVMVGVNDYKDPALQLNYPAKDAQDMGRALKAAAVKFYGKDNVFLYMLHSEVESSGGFSKPEKERIRLALEDIGKKARAEDVVFLFFAGHGVMHGAEEKRFTFLTAEASNLNPTGINTKDLESWLSYTGPHRMKANKAILVFDACNSGQATLELMAALGRNEDDPARIKQLDDLKDKSGLFILGGSALGQSAFEMRQFQQGLLTYSLLSVLKNNSNVLDGQFLNVQKWFLESERYLRDLAEQQGLRQDAKPYGTANIVIGIVDEEVVGGIVLAEEKPLVMCDNVLNGTTFNDELQLKDKINRRLAALSERGAPSPLVPASKVTPRVNRINVSYDIQGEEVVCQIGLFKGMETLLHTSVTGFRNDTVMLAQRIIEAVKPHVQ